MFVTDLAYPLKAIGQLYRDRADAENAFDVPAGSLVRWDRPRVIKGGAKTAPPTQ